VQAARDIDGNVDAKVGVSVIQTCKRMLVGDEGRDLRHWYSTEEHEML
jgi:hypothetical protein